jgi:hypothetical protein
MTYSQRRNTFSKMDRASLSKWAVQRPKVDPNEISQRQRDLWDALNQYVTERGAAITSVRYANPLRLEVLPDSPLPAKLRELGYDPVYCEQTTRLGAPVSTRQGWRTNLNNGYSFRAVDVYTVKLPK